MIVFFKLLNCDIINKCKKLDPKKLSIIILFKNMELDETPDLYPFWKM